MGHFPDDWRYMKQSSRGTGTQLDMKGLESKTKTEMKNVILEDFPEIGVNTFLSRHEI